MKILFITFSDIGVCSSSNIRNVSLIKGFLDQGDEVDIITYKSSNKALLLDNSFSLIIDQCNVIPLRGYVTSEAISSYLLTSNKLGKWKDKLYSHLRNVYYSFETIDNLRKLACSIDIEGLKLRKYDLMISSSNPYSVHILAERIKKKYFGYPIKWIQYWGDPLFLDTLTHHPILPFRIKKAEEKLMKNCDKVVYTNEVVLNMQKKVFPKIAHKMTYIETPYAFAIPKKDERIYQVGYFGGYSTSVRDILPLYSVLKRSNYQSIIIGNGDVKIESQNNLNVMARASVDIVSDIESKTRILVCICNKLSKRGNETGQIPGKIYHYGSSTHEILVIGATPMVKQFLSSYNRFVFVDNNEDDIERTIQNMLNKPECRHESLTETLPNYVAKKFTEGYVEINKELMDG
ncbi:hypothetical protein [Holdemania massiliensis]|uniref:hypothetical protein n=1 Tax=Holdemania massiliensis TaxID=1468449 RepID=UPI001F05AC47|nr:hypothetical protein [Holdemania massiliensis]MCH1941118.1 hypothetical protein [Holdemania massiliensis]